MMPFDERKDAYDGRRHLRHELRVRLRLPARQHGRLARGRRPARPRLRDRRRGRLDPDRRGAHAADHLRRARGRRARPTTTSRASSKGLDGVRREAGRSRRARPRTPAPTTSSTRSTRRSRRCSGSIEKVERALGIDNLYDPRNAQLVNHLNQALKAQSLYHRDVDYVDPGRRGEDRRRVHRPDHGRPPLVGGPAPGGRGEGGRADPGGARHAGDDHAPELLPPLRRSSPA